MIDVGWYLAAYQRGGGEFWYKQIIYENLDRFLGEETFRTHHTFASQVFWLATRLFPWNVALVLAPLRWARGRRQDLFGQFLHLWWLSIFVFYLFAAGHRSVYLLPIYPAVALLAARECAAFLDRRGKTFSDSQTAISRWAAVAVFIATIDSALALAVPITRTAQEDTNDQEAFVEDVVPKIPATATPYATPEFPKPHAWFSAIA